MELHYLTQLSSNYYYQHLSQIFNSISKTTTPNNNLDPPLLLPLQSITSEVSSDQLWLVSYFTGLNLKLLSQLLAEQVNDKFSWLNSEYQLLFFSNNKQQNNIKLNFALIIKSLENNHQLVIKINPQRYDLISQDNWQPILDSAIKINIISPIEKTKIDQKNYYYLLTTALKFTPSQQRLLQRNCDQASLAITMQQRNLSSDSLHSFLQQLAWSTINLDSYQCSVKGNKLWLSATVQVGSGCYQAIVKRSFLLNHQDHPELLQQYQQLKNYYLQIRQLITPGLKLDDFYQQAEKLIEPPLYNLGLKWDIKCNNPANKLLAQAINCLQVDDIVYLSLSSKQNQFVTITDTLLIIIPIRQQGYKLLTTAAGYDGQISLNLGINYEY